MLTLLIGTDWIANREAVMKMLSRDIECEMANRILIVPELISHDTERRLCTVAGDTASRFAEVLSFSRLTRRVSETIGFGLPECLDNGGRVVAMASAARQLHSELKAYASMETRPEFLTGLVEAIDEFKRCCITPDVLSRAAAQTEGSLAQKLEELALIFETYDGLCKQGKRDPRDQMTWLLEQMEDSSFAEDHVFFIDGFPDFTRQHFAILEHLIQHSKHVTISLNCDRPNSKNLAFEKAGYTTQQLLRSAQSLGVAVEIREIAPRNDTLTCVRSKLFHGQIEPQAQLTGALHTYRCTSIYEECVAAAEQIMSLVHNGIRYRDISVVCSDMSAYQNMIGPIFEKCHIPAYQSGTEDILEKSLITTVLSAVDAALSGFDRREVLKYAKSMLSPLSLQNCDRLENYAIMWNISGKHWFTPWTNHPRGLGERWTEHDNNELRALNASRSGLIDPLLRLNRAFDEATNLKRQILALYQFLEDIQLTKRLATLSMHMETDGDYRNAQILNQLWEILLVALEQMYDVLGDTSWNKEHFVHLLKLLLSQYDVGTIPPVLDAVMVGPISAMRCQQAKHLIVMGALEGSLPGYGGSTGILTDQERNTLRSLGVPLTGGSLEGLQAEFAEIYGVFCGAEQSIRISCPAGQPSFIYHRLQALNGKESCVDTTLGAARRNAFEAGAFLARWNAEDVAKSIGILNEYSNVDTRRKHQLGLIDQDNIKRLYGTKLNLSASQVDRLADCRMSYFLKYGLRAKERKQITVDPAEFGTYVHAVLENSVKKIMELGGFQRVSLDEALEIAHVFSEEYAQERFALIDSKRIHYLFQRNALELEMILQELWEELRESQFVPFGFEVAFGADGGMDAIAVSGAEMDAQLRGFVDRVDVWHDGKRQFFRVVDYKTGKKDFDYCDIYNGLGLQMLLYLFALEEGGASLLGDSRIPAGVQYFPARAPLVTADGLLNDEEVAAAREKLWQRRGLLLNNESALSAMEPGDMPKRLCFKRRKDGSISGDLADTKQFQLLKGYVFALLGKMVNDIASGCVEANPYTRGSSHNACTFCPYGAICHENDVAGRRNYKTMTAEQFWEDVEKEMQTHG